MYLPAALLRLATIYFALSLAVPGTSLPLAQKQQQQTSSEKRPQSERSPGQDWREEAAAAAAATAALFGVGAWQRNSGKKQGIKIGEQNAKKIIEAEKPRWIEQGKVEGGSMKMPAGHTVPKEVYIEFLKQEHMSQRWRERHRAEDKGYVEGMNYRERNMKGSKLTPISAEEQAAIEEEEAEIEACVDKKVS